MCLLVVSTPWINYTIVGIWFARICHPKSSRMFVWKKSSSTIWTAFLISLMMPQLKMKRTEISYVSCVKEEVARIVLSYVDLTSETKDLSTRKCCYNWKFQVNKVEYRHTKMAKIEINYLELVFLLALGRIESNPVHPSQDSSLSMSLCCCWNPLSTTRSLHIKSSWRKPQRKLTVNVSTNNSQ